VSQQYDPYTDPGFGYSCLCGDYDHGTVPERIICAACKVEEQKHKLATLTQERDALREVVREFVDACNENFTFTRLCVRGEWLLTPGGEAGKGGGV